VPVLIAGQPISSRNPPASCRSVPHSYLRWTAVAGRAAAGRWPKTSTGPVCGDGRQSRTPCSLCLLGFEERVHASVSHLPSD